MGEFDTIETDRVLTSMFEEEGSQMDQIISYIKNLTPEQRKSLLESIK